MSEQLVLRERLLYFALDLSARGALQHPTTLQDFLGTVTTLEAFVTGSTSPVIPPEPPAEVTTDASSN